VASLLTYVLTTRAERERRPPSIAISWVLGLIALPYVVLPRTCCSDAANCLGGLSRACGALSRHALGRGLIESFGLPGSAPAGGMHQNARRPAPALFETISRASRRLDLCTIIGRDAFGEEVTARSLPASGAACGFDS